MDERLYYYLHGDIPGYDLCSLLGTTLAGGIDSLWFFKQLVWEVGDLLDKRLWKTCPIALSPAGGASSSATNSEDGLPKAGMELQTILGSGARHMASELTEYLNATRGVLATPRIVYVSMAPDAGKFGHRGLKLCPVFENAQGIGFWAAPQVLGERSLGGAAGRKVQKDDALTLPDNSQLHLESDLI